MKSRDLKQLGNRQFCVDVSQVVNELEPSVACYCFDSGSSQLPSWSKSLDASLEAASDAPLGGKQRASCAQARDLVLQATALAHGAYAANKAKGRGCNATTGLATRFSETMAGEPLHRNDEKACLRPGAAGGAATT